MYIYVYLPFILLPVSLLSVAPFGSSVAGWWNGMEAYVVGLPAPANKDLLEASEATYYVFYAKRTACRSLPAKASHIF